MSSGILLEQLLVLLALMATGLIAYKTRIIDDHTHQHLSSMMVWILNPFLMISGVIGKSSNIKATFVAQNIMMVCGLYTALFLLGFVYILILRYQGKEAYLYRLVLLFPNVGFMGVPLVKEIFGKEYVVYVAFYMLAFNLLCYSYGVHLSARLGGKTGKFQWKKLISPGTVTSLMAIGIFALQPTVPTPIVAFVDYLGNASIAFSMIIIGVSLAKLDWRSAFAKKDYYLFAVVKMIIVPVILVFGARFLPFDATVIGVFQIMACMPIASMTCMFAQEYGGDGSECAKMVAMTTVLTVITAPLVILIAG